MPEHFTIVVNKQLLDVIAAGLSELPYRVAAAAIQELNRQLAEQMKPAEPKSEVPAE